jgi:hypothetical protein
MDATREFCPHCGNHTMMKVRSSWCCIYPFYATSLIYDFQVSMAVDEDGVVHFSRGIKRFNLRGTQ